MILFIEKVAFDSHALIVHEHGDGGHGGHGDDHGDEHGDHNESLNKSLNRSIRSTRKSFV